MPRLATNGRCFGVDYLDQFCCMFGFRHISKRVDTSTTMNIIVHTLYEADSQHHPHVMEITSLWFLS